LDSCNEIVKVATKIEKLQRNEESCNENTKIVLNYSKEKE